MKNKVILPLSAAMTITLVATAFLPMLVRSLGSKKKVFLVSSIVAIVPPALLLMTGVHEDNFAILAIFLAVNGIIGGAQQVPFAMIPDVADYNNDLADVPAGAYSAFLTF